MLSGKKVVEAGCSCQRFSMMGVYSASEAFKQHFPYLQVLNLQIKIDIQISRFLRNIKILPARAKTY